MPSSKHAQVPLPVTQKSLRRCRTAYLLPISSPLLSPSSLSASYWFTGAQRDTLFSVGIPSACLSQPPCPSRRVSTSCGRKFRQHNSTENLAVKVFCCWDFKVTKRISVRLQSKKVSTQLKVWSQVTTYFRLKGPYCAQFSTPKSFNISPPSQITPLKWETCTSLLIAA